MAVITMTREMGSLGRDVALGLAERLGLNLVQHELVEHIAEKMHMQESSVNRFLEGKAGLLERWGINENDMSLFTMEELLAVARRDNVLIRGWGATYVLREIAHVTCVRICAPVAMRAGNVMERVGIANPDVAMKEVRRNDAAYARRMQHLFHVDYRDPMFYDMVFNTEKVSVDACIDMIAETVSRPEKQPTPESTSRLEQMVTLAHVRSALRRSEITSRPTPSLTIELDPESGELLLSGVADDQAFKDEAERLAREVPGIASVRNELIVVRSVLGP